MSDELLLHVDRRRHTCLYEYWHQIWGDLLLHVHRRRHTSFYKYSHQTPGELLLHVQRRRYTRLSAHAYRAPEKVNMTLFIAKQWSLEISLRMISRTREPIEFEGLYNS
jgi:hypothetical protein